MCFTIQSKRKEVPVTRSQPASIHYIQRSTMCAQCMGKPLQVPAEAAVLDSDAPQCRPPPSQRRLQLLLPCWGVELRQLLYISHWSLPAFRVHLRSSTAESMKTFHPDIMGVQHSQTCRNKRRTCSSLRLVNAPLAPTRSFWFASSVLK